MHTGGNAVEIKTEATCSDVTEYHPPDDKPSAGMFGILCTFSYFMCVFIVCVLVLLAYICNAWQATIYHPCYSFYF